MNDRLQMRVVEIERMRSDAVDERCARDVDALAPSEDRRLWRRGKLRHRCDCRLGRRMMRSADRAADPVQDRALRLTVDAIVPPARRMRRDEFGKRARDRRSVHINGPWCW